MAYTSFDQMTGRVRGFSGTRRIAVAAAQDLHTLEAVMRAQADQIATPLLVGDKAIISDILLQIGGYAADDCIVHEPDPVKACAKAVRLVYDGNADFLMKGQIDTKFFLKAVVNKKTGLGRGGVMSNFAICTLPGYHKMLTVVDGGMLAYPTLEQKKALIQNTVDTLVMLGYQIPKVAVLTCVEKVNPDMPETVEAERLAEMNRNGEICGCIVEGPISYDCAISKEAAEYKGYSSRIAGETDVMVAPNIHAGNIMCKMLSYSAGAQFASIIAGALRPIILTSRATTSEEKYLSILLAAAAT